MIDSLKREYPPISLSSLQTLIDTGRLDQSKPIDLAAICNTKLFTLIPDQNHYGFQLTDEGLDSFSAKVNIEVQWASEQVIAAVERNGGVITTGFYDIKSLWALKDPFKFFSKGKQILEFTLTYSILIVIVFERCCHSQTSVTSRRCR